MVDDPHVSTCGRGTRPWEVARLARLRRDAANDLYRLARARELRYLRRLRNRLRPKLWAPKELSLDLPAEKPRQDAPAKQATLFPAE
jgi:hypothetical protein